MTQHQAPWWQHGVIYQIYPRSFKDSNGDGIGDLRGILSQLAYLNWLGVDALWISPFYPSPMVDFGYDVNNYTDVDPIFGDMATFDELVQQAHHYGIKVVIDFVINHTSDQHLWFLESRSSRNAAKRQWYIWADAAVGASAERSGASFNPSCSPPIDWPCPGLPPNNWVSLFGGSAWEWDAATGQYYLHSFDKRQPDLNWRNPEVQSAMFDVLRFWLEHGVDGFRIDAAHMIMKDPQLRDNPPNLTRARVMHKPMGSYDEYLHIYDKGHPDAHGIYRALRRLLDSYSGEQQRVAIGELHIPDWKVWTSYYGANLDEMHIPFNFDLVSAAWNAQAIRRSVDALEANLPPGAWPNYVLGNHDEPRIASRVGPAHARLAMLLLLTLRGTPTLYYGDEIGMHNGDIPPERVYDPLEKHMPGLGLGRDPARTPMQWDSSPNAGFCPPGVDPWLPIPTDYRQINVAVEREDPYSLLTLTRRLIELRRSTPALMAGSYRPIDGAGCRGSALCLSVGDFLPEDCFIYLRQSSNQRYLIALNFAGNEQIVELPEMGKGRIVLSTYMDCEELAVDLASLQLRGNEGCVIELA